MRGRLDESAIVFTSANVIAEVYSKYIRSSEAASALDRVEFIQAQAALTEIDGRIGLEAGRIHAQQKRKNPGFSLADAFVLAAARARHTQVVTFDSAFRGIEDADVLV